MHELIRTATAELSTFLSTYLPALGEDWWETNVVDRLSFQQQRAVSERGLTSLQQLDFSAMLRLFDKNWYELSQALTLPREGRTWIRELQTVRNRWAHLSATPVPAQDIYRDADTLARVLDMLNATPASISAVEAAKRDALSELTSPSDTNGNSANYPSDTSAPLAASTRSGNDIGARHASATTFEVGDLVALGSSPETEVASVHRTAWRPG